MQAGNNATMTNNNKLLSVLSDAEQEALYGLPDFDDGQQLEYLSLSETELALASSRPGLHAQVYCVLQIGYFKAKHAFFRFDWSMVEDDCAFVLSRYFHGEAFEREGDHRSRALHPARLDCRPLRLPAVVGSVPATAWAASGADHAPRCDARFRGGRTDRLAQRAQDCPPWLHHPAGADQQGTVRRTPAPGRPAGARAGRQRPRPRWPT